MTKEYKDWTRSEDQLLTWALNKILEANAESGYHTDEFEEAYIDCFLCNLLYAKGKTMVRSFANHYYTNPTGMQAFKNL